MTWAPRGIFSTKSLKVGRMPVYVAPCDERKRVPSADPRMVSCGRMPACVWNSPPSASTTRYRRFLLSTSRTWSPGAKARLTAESAPADAHAPAVVGLGQVVDREGLAGPQLAPEHDLGLAADHPADPAQRQGADEDVEPAARGAHEALPHAGALEVLQQPVVLRLGRSHLLGHVRPAGSRRWSSAACPPAGPARRRGAAAGRRSRRRRPRGSPWRTRPAR